MDNAVRRVTIKVETQDKKDQRAVPVTTEVDRGAGQVRVGGEDVVCNGPERSFDLHPGERLVIDGFTPEAIQYDRDQAAAYSPATQKGAQLDQPSPAEQRKLDEANKAQAAREQTSQTGAKPSETQDSRIKSSPGTTVTPGMSTTPSANTGAPASKPNAPVKP